MLKVTSVDILNTNNLKSIKPLEIPIPVGQLYWPNFNEYETQFRALFERGYYTNHGPLLNELENQLCQYLDVKNVICVTNATIGLIMASEALDLNGKVITPSFTFIATPQSLAWSGIEPVFCDVNLEDHQIDPFEIEKLITPDVTAILGVNLWGNCCSPDVIVKIAKKYNIKVFFDSAHSFGCKYGEKFIGNFGDLEVFSFHATKIFSTGEGGCITTNNDALAEKLRNIRSSYGINKIVEVTKTSNGRMSEAQAAIGLLNLKNIDFYISRNLEIFNLYKEKLSQISGLELYEATNVSASNYQYIVCKIDESKFGITRDELCDILIAKNIIARKYFNPGSHKVYPFLQLSKSNTLNLPNTEILNSQLLQLPIGSKVTNTIVNFICEVIKAVKTSVDALEIQ
jgi:dTDP-4-amino-4,6-dideoxygalactose transaminase